MQTTQRLLVEHFRPLVPVADVRRSFLWVPRFDTDTKFLMISGLLGGGHSYVLILLLYTCL
jgi:hypothetical protein